MSFSALTWARKLTVGNGIAKAVLRHLADVADGDGCSHYGFEALCREVEFTPRAVAKAIGYLIERGLLDKQQRYANGKCLAPCWRVLIPGTAPADSHPPKRAVAPANPHPLSPCESADLAPAKTQGNPVRESKEGKVPPSLRDSPKGANAAKRTSLADDWQPGPKGVAFAEEHGVDVETELPRFIAHHQAKQNRMVWDAAWRTWCLNDEKWRRRPGPSGERRPEFRNGFAESVVNDHQRRQGAAAAASRPAPTLQPLPSMAELLALDGEAA